MRLRSTPAAMAAGVAILLPSCEGQVHLSSTFRPTEPVRLLMTASRRGDVACIEDALRAGAAVDVDAIEALLAAGAPVDYKDERGRTALWAAVDGVCRDAIDVLELHGAAEW